MTWDSVRQDRHHDLVQACPADAIAELVLVSPPSPKSPRPDDKDISGGPKGDKGHDAECDELCGACWRGWGRRMGEL